jgi:transposase
METNVKNQKLPGLNLENLENFRSVPKQDLMRIGEEKIKSLKILISDVQEMISQREFLSQQIIQETEKIKMEIENFLMANKNFDADNFRERNGLREKQVEISELQLNEKINCWKDIALLKKELREYQRALSEKEERAEIFNGVLE